MISRRTVLTIGIGACAAAVTGCGDHGPASAVQPELVGTDRLQGALAQFSALWSGGDWEKVASFVDPSNHGEARRAFTAIHSLPRVKTEIIFLPGGQHFSQPDTTGEIKTNGYVLHRVEGIDQYSLSSPAILGFRFDQQGQVIFSSFAIGRSSWVAPWDIGDVETVVSEHLIIMSPVAEIDKVRALIAAYEQEILNLQADFGVGNIPTHAIMYQAEDAINTMVYGSGRNSGPERGAIGGYCYSVSALGDNATVTRIIIRNLGSEFPPEYYPAVFRHEFTHAVQNFLNTGRKSIPTWVIEGSASWVGWHGLLVSLDDFLGHRPTAQDIDHLAGVFTGARTPEVFGVQDYGISSAFFSWAETKLGKARVAQMIIEVLKSADIERSLAQPLGASSMAELMPEFTTWALAAF